MVYIIEAWIDGACRRNGRPDATGGVGLYIPRLNVQNYWSYDSDSDPSPTNQRMELQGAIEALDRAKQRYQQLRSSPYLMVRIHTDSKYVVGCFTEWIYKWQRNGWANARGAPVSNQDLIEEAWELVQDLEDDGEVDFIYIPRSENEEADRLANLGCDEAY